MVLGQPFKRRKLSASTDSQSLSSHSRRPFSHGLEDFKPSAHRVDEVHVHIRNHSPPRSPLSSPDGGYHRHHRRQTGTGLSASSSSPTILVSVVASVDASGSTVDVSTLTASSSSPSSTVTDPDSASSDSASAAPQSSATTPMYPLTSTTTLISSGTGTGATSATAVLSGTAPTSTTDAQTTSMANSSSSDTASSDTSTTSTSANTSHGMIGFSATSASVTSTASVASLGSSLFPTGSNSTASLTSYLSGQASASDSRNMTTSATIISNAHTTYTSLSTYSFISSDDASSTMAGVGSIYSDYTTFMTTLANGAVATMTEERAALVTLLSDGDLTTSYGSFVAYSTGTTATSSGSSFASTSPSGTSKSDTNSHSSSATSATETATSASQSYAQTTGSSLASGSATSSAVASASSSAGTTGDSSSNSTTPPASVLAGGIVGGVAGLAVLLLVAMVILRWYRKRAAPMQLLSQSESTATPTGGTGGGPRGLGMAERAGLAPVLTPLLGAVGLARRSRAPSDTGERGFQRVSGRKLPSAFSEGMTSHPASHPPPMPAFNTERNLSGTSFYRDSTGFYGGEGASGTSPFADPTDLDEANETIMPGPARQATVHPPYALSPTSATTATPSPMTPTFPERQELLNPSSPPGTANRSATPATVSSFEGSRGSRFTEEV